MAGPVNARTRENLETLARTREAWARFFPKREGIRIQMHAGMMLPGAYDSSADIAYLNPQFDQDSFRHELAHALIWRNAGDVPYWYQEGAAYFLQSAGEARCGGTVMLSKKMAERALGRIQSKQDALPWDAVDLGDRSSALDTAALSAAFFLFAWSKRDLEGLLKTPPQMKGPPPWLNDHADFEKSFRAFLETGLSKPVPGC